MNQWIVVTDADRLVESGYRVVSTVTGVSDKESGEFLARLVDGMSGADGLVHSAAMADGVGDSSFWETDEDFFQRVMNVKVFGTWLVNKRLFPQMTAKKSGAIVNVASDAALNGSPQLIHDVGSKAHSFP